VDSHDRPSETNVNSLHRREEVVLRLLAGEPLDQLAKEIGESPARITKWRDNFLASGRASLARGQGPRGERSNSAPAASTARLDRHAWLLKLHRAATAANAFTNFVLRPLRRRLTESQYSLVHLLVYVVLVVSPWLLIWVVQWQLFPDWLVDSRAGMSTLLQVVPGTVVALFVLIVGSVLVAGQLAVAAYGTRAAALLVNDPHLRGLVVRALLVVPPALLLAGQVPDSERPSDASASAASTIVLFLTFDLILAAAAQLPATLLQYTAPRHFQELVVADAADGLRLGRSGSASHAIATLGDMLKAGVRRNDSGVVEAAVEGLGKVRVALLESFESTPDVRVRDPREVSRGDDWLGQELRDVLVAAADEGLGRGSRDDRLDAITSELGTAATVCLRFGRDSDARVLLTGLAELGVSSSGFSGSLGGHLYSAPAEALARVEATAEECDAQEIAADALAAWLLLTSYAQFHFGLPQHPRWAAAVDRLGRNPPWEQALAIIASSDWQQRWASQLPLGPDPVLRTASPARSAHGRR
jgi:hypothetical protein